MCVNCFGLVGQDEADGVQQIGVLLDVPAQVSTAQWQELGLGAALSGRRTSFPHLGQVSAGGVWCCIPLPLGLPIRSEITLKCTKFRVRIITKER